MEIKKITPEIKHISGYNNLYSVSTEGVIKNIQSNYVKKQHKNKWGYNRVELCDAGVCKKHSVHRLVAKAFIPNPNNLPEVNHKDGDKNNNHVSNLEWCTNSENKTHSYISNLRVGPSRKFNTTQINEIKQLSKAHVPLREIARRFNANHKTISSIITNKTYKNGI